MNRTMPGIGAQLKAIRLKAGLRQEDLAAKIDVSQATVSYVERGGATTTDVVERWADACGAQVAISAGFDADLDAAVFDLSDADKARLLRIARSLPGAPEAAKSGMTLAFEQLGGG
jgi:transcriptional regulator with XRE-family HTH domain